MSEQLSGFNPMNELPGIDFNQVIIPFDPEGYEVGRKEAFAEYIAKAEAGEFGNGELVVATSPHPDIINKYVSNLRRVIPTQYNDPKTHSQKMENGSVNTLVDVLQVEDFARYPLKPKYLFSGTESVNDEEVQNLLNRFKASKNGNQFRLESFLRIFDGYKVAPKAGEVFYYGTDIKYFAEAEVTIDYMAVTLPNNRFVIHEKIDAGDEREEQYYVDDYKNSDRIIGVFDKSLILDRKKPIEEKIALAISMNPEDEEFLIGLASNANDSLEAINGKISEFYANQ